MNPGRWLELPGKAAESACHIVVGAPTANGVRPRRADPNPTKRTPVTDQNTPRPGRARSLYEPGNQDQVAEAVARDLVGDVAIAAEGVSPMSCPARDG